MTDKEKALGLEVAKLALKVHRQRLVIGQRGYLKTDPLIIAVTENAREVPRQNDGLRRQIMALQTENRALRIYIAEQKVTPGFWGTVHLWLKGREK